MSVVFQSKNLYAAGGREGATPYSAVLCGASGSEALAYLRVEGRRETLTFRAAPDAPERILARDTYIFSPCFAGEWFFWVERCGAQWSIRAARVEGENIGEISAPFSHRGRPLSLSSCADRNGAWLVWEEREGRSTRVFAARIQDREIGGAVAVTDGTYNAYDPVCAVSGGELYIAYSAFRWGNYRVLLQKLTDSGERIGEPLRLSNRAAACVYPSLWPRAAGGVWFSLTHFDGGFQTPLTPWVQHHRRAAQQEFFNSRGVVSAGIFDGENVQAVLAPAQPNADQAEAAALLVYGSEGCGHSQIIEDETGRAHLLLRQHAPPGGGEPEFAEGNFVLQKSRDLSGGAEQMQPGISVMTLHDSPLGWSAPRTAVARAHLEASISCALDGDFLRVAFTEDGRATGWNRSGERFDGESQSGVGAARLRLESTPPKYALCPYRFHPLPGPSMEAPRMAQGDGEWIYALGQTHLHTGISVCLREKDRDVHLNFRFLQDVQNSDFAAVTDHDYNMWPLEEMLTRKHADYYDFPGAFVALPGYEWTGSDVNSCSHDGGPFGHLNVIGFEYDTDLEVLCACNADSAGASPGKVARHYAGQRVLALPHHVADSAHPFYWEFFEETIAPMVEIFQDYRGSGESAHAPGVSNFLHHECGHWAVDELKRGRRFGLIAGGDHCGFARAGVLVRELTRAGLYEALQARRCFATTGTALQLEFRCNGVLMGEEVRGDTANFELWVEAAEELHEIQIVRDGGAWREYSVAGCSAQLQWQSTRERDGEFWYLRVLLANGEMAWSSPLWLCAGDSAYFDS